MSRKSVLSTVYATSNGAFEAVSRRIAGQQQRSFTSTPQRNVQIGNFSPTSSPDLDALLSEIRHKIILPSYLPISQRKQIYSSKWERKLRSDPIVMELDGEIIKFRHQNLMTEIPNTQKSLIAAVSQFETGADFQNLAPLLEGIAHVGNKISVSAYTKVVRLAGEKGLILSIIDCARSVRRTRLKLDTSEKVNLTLHFVQMKACDAEWDESATNQYLRWAETVVDMLYNDLHQPKTAPVPGEISLTCDPMVLAAPLHLAAVLVARHNADEKMLGKVRKLARNIVAYWPEGKKMGELQPAELYAEPDKMKYLREPNKFVMIATPLLHGLETAAKVLEPELASQLKSRCETLAAEIQEARKNLPEIRLRGKATYEKFYGAEQKEVENDQ